MAEGAGLSLARARSLLLDFWILLRAFQSCLPAFPALLFRPFAVRRERGDEAEVRRVSGGQTHIKPAGPQAIFLSLMAR